LSDTGQFVMRRARIGSAILLLLGLVAASAVVASPAAAGPPILTGNEVVGWGNNSAGSLGDGTTIDPPIHATAVGLPTNVIKVSTNGTSFGLTADGHVWSWGLGTYGQLGDGTMVSRATPGLIPGLSGITQISTGLLYGLALRSDGTVWAWGYNSAGTLGDGTTISRPTPVQVVGLANVVQIVAAGYYSMALRSDGTVWTWGLSVEASLGNVGVAHLVPTQVAGLFNVLQIAGAEGHALALARPNRLSVVTSLYTWGDNWHGQLGDGTVTTRTAPVPVVGLGTIVIDSIATGALNSFVLASDGSVWSWGDNHFGELGDGAKVAYRTVPAQAIGPKSGITQLSAANYHVLALRSDGIVEGWGRNEDSELGGATSAPVSWVPVTIPLLSDVSQVSAGWYISLVVHRVPMVTLP
jgi:alpha-tubulin suppressor-like RCC1 family protein